MQRDWKHIVHNELRTNERSIAWLSRRLGYSPSHVNRLLSGERPLPEDKKTNATCDQVRSNNFS